jgi:hypothetical protein
MCPRINQQCHGAVLPSGSEVIRTFQVSDAIIRLFGNFPPWIAAIIWVTGWVYPVALELD